MPKKKPAKVTVKMSTCEFYFSHQDMTCWLCGVFVPKGTPHACASKEST